MKSSVAGVVLVLAAAARAGTLHVPADSATIQSAIVAAQDGDEILVQPGVYAESLDTLGKAITLTGAGGSEVTTIDASGLDDSVIVAIGGALAIEGFTITGGAGHAVSSNRNGGGIYLGPNTTGTVRSCRIVGNDVLLGASSSSGGGAFVQGGVVAPPVFVDCDFEDNHAVLWGGGLYGGVASECRFEGNTALSGGGYYNPGYADSPQRCMFTGNHADTAGGAYVLNAAISVLASCTFTANTADTTASAAIVYGVGVPYEGGIVENCLFAGNTGGDGVALLFTQNAIFSWKLVAGCTFIGDQTDGRSFDLCIFRDGAMPVFAAATVSNSDIEGGWAGVSVANIDADPLFVDAAHGDYHLLPASPCFNKGAMSTAVGAQVDIDGEPRKQGGAPEMGADEVAEDCNGNDIPDYRDIESGAIPDANDNGVPDDCEGTWTDLGHALAGSNGVPALSSYGSLLGKHPLPIALVHAKPNTSAVLVVGITEVDLPLKGGVLVPSANVVLAGLPTGFAGILQIAPLWPAGIPSGFEVFFQAWIPDAAGPHGFAASNGLLGTTP